MLWSHIEARRHRKRVSSGEVDSKLPDEAWKPPTVDLTAYVTSLRRRTRLPGRQLRQYCERLRRTAWASGCRRVPNYSFSLWRLMVSACLTMRRRGRAAEGGGLLNRYTPLKVYRGFESLRLRHSSYMGILPALASREGHSVVAQCFLSITGIPGKAGWRASMRSACLQFCHMNGSSSRRALRSRGFSI